MSVDGRFSETNTVNGNEQSNAELGDWAGDKSEGATDSAQAIEKYADYDLRKRRFRDRNEARRFKDAAEVIQK
jgi:hypothetical protein